MLQGRDFTLEMVRNHFTFLGKTDKMAAARRRPREERDGQQGASLLDYSWNLGTGRGREDKQRRKTVKRQGHPNTS